MTTIAFKAGVLAADTLVCSGNERVGTTTKVKALGPLLYASSGSCGLADTWESWLRRGAVGEHPSLKQDDASATCILFLPDDTILWFHVDGVTHFHAPYFAIGSGSSYALGAMAVGASPEDAVLAAMRHDTGTGGRVMSIRRAIP